MSSGSQQKRHTELLVSFPGTPKRNRLYFYHLLPSKAESIRVRLMFCLYSNDEEENTELFQEVKGQVMPAVICNDLGAMF